jgi:serine/threonine-protein kinase RsbW
MELVFQSDPKNIHLVEDFIINLGESNGMDDDSINSLMIAITEAANNAILHGNESNPAKMVKVVSTLSDKHLIVSITDEGKGFDPSKVPDPLAPENLLKTSGRGVFLMKEIMKSVEYKFAPEGTTVILTFDIS